MMIPPNEREVDDVRPWQPGDGDTRCQQCGHVYVPWFTDNWIWNRVVGGPEATEDPGGYLCPRCFTTRAAKVETNAVWRLTLECYHFGGDS